MSDSNSTLTAQSLMRLLSYDQHTGVFKRLIGSSNAMGANIGDIAGSSNSEGYTVIKIGVRGYRAHRLAWLYVHGVWPLGDIDHINGNKADNSIGNLRDVSRTVNTQNHRFPRVNNKSGFLGVSPSKNHWKATIRINGKIMYLGNFATPELAHESYLQAKRKYHPGCTI